MANITVKLKVVNFTFTGDDGFKKEYTLVSQKLSIEELLEFEEKIKDTYKSHLLFGLNELHFQDYVIKIITGVLEKDIELYFRRLYCSDYTLYI